ncbi:M48 family metalloprotease [uncultured Erythrobacter sp.]|uniref:M48 family metalloprotease n=1 Tax=uncultured Erythrobacter sp. TaxID=263913 RepID=UPI0026331B9A|nr:M48 family metalloprotease [uncultured Erythrobacter sp.]
MLSQLNYHESIADWLLQNEQGVWDWFSNAKLQEEQNSETRDLLLKQTYRLSRETHGSAYECCEAAMARLGVEAPVTLYQAGDGAMNAALFFIPGEIHIVLYGPILEKLSEIELTALFGHELSHYLLWTLNERRYRIAQQIIDDAVQQSASEYALYETARLYLLSTEVFADRGAVIAAGGPDAAIAVLLKVMTGLAATDPKAFLEQAAELDAKGEIAKNPSHPETYMRALFIDRWCRDSAKGTEGTEGTEGKGIDDWVLAKLKGPMAIGSLDLLDQNRLTVITRQLFALLLHDSNLASPMVVTQIKQFFPDWQGEEEIRLDPEKLNELAQDRSIRDYMIALLIDLAHADPDQTEEMLVRGGKFAASMDWEDDYRDNLKSLLKMRKPQVDRIMRASEKVSWKVGG